MLLSTIRIDVSHVNVFLLSIFECQLQIRQSGRSSSVQTVERKPQKKKRNTNSENREKRRGAQCWEESRGREYMAAGRRIPSPAARTCATGSQRRDRERGTRLIPAHRRYAGQRDERRRVKTKRAGAAAAASAARRRGRESCGEARGYLPRRRGSRRWCTRGRSARVTASIYARTAKDSGDESHAIEIYL